MFLQFIMIFIAFSGGLLLEGKTTTGLINGLPLKKLLTGTMLDKRDIQCLYRATKDGWKAEDFHARCDVGLPSLVIGKVGGRVIGGYNPFGWSSVDDYRNTLKAFVFCQEQSGEVFVCKKIGADGAGETRHSNFAVNYPNP